MMRSAPPPLVPGHKIANSYQINREVARGGMGVLFEGTDLTGHRVAIKAILDEHASSERTQKLFEREAVALRNVRHDAVVRYHTILRDEWSRLFLIMDFVDGPALSRLAGRGGFLSPRDVEIFGARLAAGLAAAHAVGVVHRDIAPKNILLPNEEPREAVLVDFGIAKRLGDSSFTVAGGGFAGTMPYAAPEQLGLFGGEIDARTDVYALAIVMAEIAGARLALGTSMADAVRLRASDVTLPDGADPRLKARLEPMLRADPAQRPVDILDAWTREIPLTPKGGTRDFDLSRDTGKSARKPRRLGLAIGVGAASVAAVVVALTLDRTPAPDQPKGGGSIDQADRATTIVQKTASPMEKFDEAKRLLASGDVDSLNVAYAVMATLSREGLADASLTAGELLDPEYFSTRSSPFSKPNPTRALKFYQAALEQGAKEAEFRIRRLQPQ